MSNAMSIDLRVFPPDVQDLLRDRAVAERRRIEDVIRDFTNEVAGAVCAAAGGDGGPDGNKDFQTEDAA